LDLEGGYQHHSNGKDGFDSRHIDLLYLKPTFVWRLGDHSHLFFAPMMWSYLTKSILNDDIADYWGWIDFELTWRADFGLQLETHTIPASEGTTFAFQATQPALASPQFLCAGRLSKRRGGDHLAIRCECVGLRLRNRLEPVGPQRIIFPDEYSPGPFHRVSGFC